MKYSLGDKFVIEGVEGQVRYINNGNAWLFPVITEDMEDAFRGKGLIKGVAFVMIDKDGRTKDGAKAYATVNNECQAV